MKSGTRNLVIVAAAIVVLGGAAAALALTGGGKGTSSSAASSSINLISKKSEDVVSMSVKNKKGSYQIVPEVVPANSAAANFTASGSASSASSGSATTTTYTVEGLDGAPVDSSLTQQVFQNGYSLVGSQDLGETGKLEEFGLKDPQATVEVRYKDGSSITYLLGNASATDSTAYYMCTQGSTRVYVVSVDAGIFEGKTYFVKKDILSISSDSSSTSSTGSTANDFTAITLTGKNYAKPIVMYKEGSALAMTSPYKASLDATNLTALEGALTTVTAASVEAVNPDAAALKKYGLDNPAASVSFLVNNGAYKLLAGSKTGDNYYVMLDKGKIVYQVAAGSVDAWVNTTAFALRGKNLLTPVISTVKTVTFSKGGASSSVTVARAKDEKQSTQDNTVYTYTATAGGGTKLDYDKVYQPFYAKLITPEILEESTAKPAGSPAYALEYQYFDKSGKDTVQFYAAGDRRYLAVVNGETAGIVTSSDIDTLYTEWQQMLSGKTGS